MFGNSFTSLGQTDLALADLINTKSTSDTRIFAAMSSASGRRSPRLVSMTDAKSKSLSYTSPEREKKNKKVPHQEYEYKTHASQA